MKLSYTEWEVLKAFSNKLDTILANQVEIKSKLEAIFNQGAAMATKQDLQQNMQDLRDLGQQYLDFIKAKDDLIAERDATVAALQQQIADLLAQVAAGQITIAEAQAKAAELQASIDEAVTSSQATEDALRAGLPGVPPVGGTTLDLSYADKASFDAAVAAYTGPEAVTLDGVEVKAGTTPSLDYFTHSATGEINTSGPTD